MGAGSSVSSACCNGSGGLVLSCCVSGCVSGRMKDTMWFVKGRSLSAALMARYTPGGGPAPWSLVSAAWSPMLAVCAGAPRARAAPREALDIMPGQPSTPPPHTTSARELRLLLAQPPFDLFLNSKLEGGKNGNVPVF